MQPRGRAQQTSRTHRSPKGTPEPVRIRLLGGFGVSVGSRTIGGNAWGLRKAANLVKILALSPGHSLHREQIMDFLWPELSPKAASNNLRGVLHVTRQALDRDQGGAASRYLTLQGEQLTLYPSGQVWVDVEAFEEAAQAARRRRELAAYKAALDLYAGDLLPEDRYEEWAEGRRAELRRLYLTLLADMADLYEQRAEYGPAIDALGEVVAEESANEEAHVRLMRLHALRGQRQSAMMQYERLREALKRELGAEPSPTTRGLREEIAAGRFPSSHEPPAGPPAKASAVARSHNLPALRTSLVGRGREMVEVKRTLAMTQFLTLTGTGGCGKTRLALEVAHSLVGAYPDGVRLVELVGLTDPDLLPQSVATTLEIREQPGRPLLDTLLEALHDKEMLLVLDNCEHQLDAAARLAEAILYSCPHLRVLATSRQPLGVAGEQSWLVPSLSAPGVHQSPTVEELEGYESARLFAERASNRHPGFELRPENAKAVAQVCARLEGIPLAIELAAARIGVLSAGQISERLGHSLKLLTGGRTADHRHRTLRAALHWSYELLSEREQALFAKLSAFAGGFTLETAEVVGAGENFQEGDVLEFLGGLVDKSLVVAEESWESGARYRLLEPVRQYSRERLEESGEVETVLRRHAVFFLALAEEAELGLEGAQQTDWLGRLEAEHDNLRAALSWSLERGEDAELGLRMGAALGEFWYLRGYFGEGRRWLEEALAKASQAPAAARARALFRVSWLAFLQGDFDRAQDASEEGLGLEGVTLFRTGGGDSVAAESQRMLGLVVSNRGDIERAIERYEESLALSREAGSVRGMAVSLFCLGVTWREAGELARATEFLEEALSLCRESGDPALLASILTNLGHTFLLQGDLERATTLSEEAAVAFREQEHRAYLADALNSLGWVALIQGDPKRARALYAESVGLRREVGDKQGAPESLEGLACTAWAQGEAKRAARLFGSSEALREVMDSQADPGHCMLREPYLAAARSQQSEAGWEKAWEEGTSMSFEEAIEYALSDEETATHIPTALEQPSPRTQQPELTRREEEVASLVAQGRTNRQVATKLSISEHTVATHVGKTMRKLGLSSRSQLAAWVTERGRPTSDSG